MWCTPLDLDDEPFDADRLLKLADDPKVVAIGETGLDYYYSAENKTTQQAIFANQIQIANQLNKPVIVHTAVPEKIPFVCWLKTMRISAVAYYIVLLKIGTWRKRLRFRTVYFAVGYHHV